MKQFSLEEYIANPEKKVVTKEGLPVRILCTDRMDAHSDYVKKPIVALVLLKDKIQEQVVNYTKDGHLLTPGQEDDLDLFFADEEPELTEFEKAVLNLCEDMFQGPVGREEAKKRAKELLEIAREELFHNDAVLKEYAETARERGITKEIEL